MISGMRVFSGTGRLLVNDDAVPHLAMFVIGKHGATDKLVGVGVRTFGDNAVRCWGGNAGQGHKVLLRCLIPVDRTLVAQPVLQAFGNGLGIALHHGGFFGSFLPNLIRIGVGAGWKKRSSWNIIRFMAFEYQCHDSRLSGCTSEPILTEQNCIYSLNWFVSLRARRQILKKEIAREKHDYCILLRSFTVRA